ncbi:MAG: response regulator [Sulfuricellaceae bacterium]|nr:response regulator [Sulfuricellaceae bacterium]
MNKTASSPTSPDAHQQNKSANSVAPPDVWRMTCNAIESPVFIHDKEFRVLAGNNAYFQAAGVSEAQAIGLPYWQVFPLGDGPLPGCRQATASAHPITEEVCVGDRIFTSSGYPLADEHGKTLYALHIMNDITEHHFVKQALRGSDSRTSAILRTMKDCVVHIDARGIILSVNDAITTLFGYEEEELIGQNVSLLTPEPHRSQHDNYLIRYLKTRQPHIIGKPREVEGQRKDGSLFDMELNVNEMVDDEGSTFLGVIRDISEQKTAQRKLEAALSAAQAATETRSRFLANMSHEIRTPINAVLGFAHLCLNLELPARGRDYTQKIHSAATSLLGIVNDILDFSKMEAGKLDIESIPFSMDDLLNQIASLFSLKAREKGVELVIGTLSGIPDRLLGDSLRLGQILTNLLSNALKFTEQGEISLTVEPESIAADTVTLRFEVLDSGIGMTPEQQDKLFTAFSQADTSTTRKFGGTGLGLSISKQLVENMGGELSVKSKAGEGSCFKFTLRFDVVTNEAAQTPVRSLIVDKRVLVVDDNAIMRTLLSRSVNTLGCKVETEDSGEAAMTRIQAGEKFDLILMDWRMPGMDGLATAHSIRASGNSMPIILITGDEPELAQANAPKGDIQAYISKPASRSTLYDAMTHAMGGHAALPPIASVQMAPPSLTGSHILLVDDNDFNRQVGRELVEITGATVDTANDGEQALAAIDARSYDLVLMDIQMPVMDGYTAARLIKDRWPDLPIIALTAHAMVDEKARVIAAGMSDILSKPILPNALYSMLAGWLADKSAPENKAAPVILPGSAALADTNPSAKHEGFDLSMALSRVNGDRKMLERFLRLFRDRNAGSVEEIGAALVRQDMAAARRLSHALKGGAGTIGMTELQAAAARMEATLTEFAQQPHDMKRHGEDFAALETAWVQAMKTLITLLDTPA